MPHIIVRVRFHFICTVAAFFVEAQSDTLVEMAIPLSSLCHSLRTYPLNNRLDENLSETNIIKLLLP